jgi:hypothetical protein
MKNIFEDETDVTSNPLYQAFELDTDERATEAARPMTAPAAESPAEFRVWRCNGVSIGLRFHN